MCYNVVKSSVVVNGGKLNHYVVHNRNYVLEKL